jgi:hypothetical protein
LQPLSIWSGAGKAEISCRGSGKSWPGIGFVPAGGPTAEAVSSSSFPDHSAHRLDRRKIDGDRFTDFLNTNFAGWLSEPLEFQPWAYPPRFLLNDVTLLVIAAAFWLMARAAPLWCWTLAFMIWLLPMLSPPLIFPVARIAPLFPVLLIVMLLRPGVSASVHGR